MKKNLPIALLLFCSSLSFAQGLSIANARKSAVAPSTHIRPNHETRSMTCANDTTLYTLLKEENLGTSTYYTTDMYNGVITEYSQTFLNTGTLTVNGISFFGNVTDFVNPAQTVTATVVLYNVNASNTPTTQITSATILLNTTFGQYTAMFTSPVTVTGNYAVALKNTSTTDTLTVFLNDAMTATYGESLGFLNAPAFGGWLAPSVAFGAGIESEGLIAPVLSYPIATNYTMSPAATTMCLGTVLTFTNTTTPTNILTNRMYNYGAFNAFWNSVPDSIYVWDMGDGSPLQWSTNAAYTYPAAGLDTVTLYTLGGLMSSCLDTKESNSICGNVFKHYRKCCCILYTKHNRFAINCFY